MLLSTLPFAYASLSAKDFQTMPGYDVHEIKLGKITCRIFKDMAFKYQAKNFFSNADDVELNAALNRYHIAADNIPFSHTSLNVSLL